MVIQIPQNVKGQHRWSDLRCGQRRLAQVPQLHHIVPVACMYKITFMYMLQILA